MLVKHSGMNLFTMDRKNKIKNFHSKLCGKNDIMLSNLKLT